MKNYTPTKLDNLNEMGKFIETLNLLRLNYELENLNKAIAHKDIDIITKIVKTSCNHKKP